jgi:hypothetical protein
MVRARFRTNGWPAVYLALALLPLAGCGSGGGDSTGSTATQPADSANSRPHRVSPEPRSSAKAKADPANPHPGQGAQIRVIHRDAPGGAAVFETKGADNSIQESGAEAGASELSAAAVALHGYLDARAEADWAKACSYLAAALTTQLAQLTARGSGDEKAPSCTTLIAGISSGIPPSALREAAQADVGAFRVEGQRGFLLFHGSPDGDYFMPMARESGSWKVAAIAASPLQ